MKSANYNDLQPSQRTRGAVVKLKQQESFYIFDQRMCDFHQAYKDNTLMTNLPPHLR